MIFMFGYEVSGRLLNRLWPIGGVGTPTKNPKSIIDDFASRQNVQLVRSRHLYHTKGIFCSDTRYHSLVLNATYSYVHPHEINVGKTVGIPHEIRGSSPLWARAYF
jgi:hypothetical protein